MTYDNPIWRIDDRLIHGQIILGWCGQLPIKHLIVLDDDIATREWEKNLMMMAAPPGLPTHILSVDETVASMEEMLNDRGLTMILFKFPHVVKQLYDQNVPIKSVNIGGIHFREDRQEILSYLYLSKNEAELFGDLMKNGISFWCQDLPSSPSYDLGKILEKKKRWK